jgi:hypothetical protein
VISKKLCKIRNMIMENFVKNNLKNSPKNMVKNQMLKWASEGGGGSI